MSNNDTTVGAVPQNVKRTPLSAGGEWKDTPYFGPGLEKDSDHMKAFPIGMEIAGTLRALRTTKAEKVADQKEYACFTDANNNKFRIATPGQLRYQLERAGVGATVVITYKGKEEVEGYKQALHQFGVELIEGNVN